MEIIAIVVYIIVFSSIAISKDLIDCNSLVDYKNITDYASFFDIKNHY